VQNGQGFSFIVSFIVLLPLRVNIMVDILPKFGMRPQTIGANRPHSHISRPLIGARPRKLKFVFGMKIDVNAPHDRV
jgi:hypothetical protein